MPGLTQGQQSAGTGSVSSQSLNDRRNLLATDITSSLGGMPSHQALRAMQSGQPIGSPVQAGPGAAPGIQATPNQPQQSAQVPPAQAGQMNAQAPGIFNQNPATGYSGTEDGFAKAAGGMAQSGGGMAQTTAPPMRPPPVPVRQPQAPQRGQPSDAQMQMLAAQSRAAAQRAPASATPVPPPPGQAPPPDNIPWAPGFGSPHTQTPHTQPPAAAPTPQMPVPGAGPAGPVAAQAKGATAPDPEDAGKPWQQDSRSFGEKFGEPKPAAWSRWSPEQRAKWKANRYQAGTTAVGAGPTQGQAPGQEKAAEGGGQVVPPTFDPIETIGEGGRSIPIGDKYYTSGYINKDPRGEGAFTTPKPDDWNKMSKDQRDAWLTQNYVPFDPQTMGLPAMQGKEDEYSYPGSIAEYLANIGNVDEAALLEALGYGGGFEIPDIETTTPFDFGEVPYTTGIESFTTPGGPNYVEDPDIRRLLQKYSEAANAINVMSADPNRFKDARWAERNEEYGTLQAVLGRYGINWSPAQGVFQPEPGPGDVGSGRDDTNTGNTDVMSGLPHFQQGDLPGIVMRFFGINPKDWKGMSSTKKSAAFDQYMEMLLTDESLRNKQGGINIIQGGYDKTLAENNPLRQGSEDLALQALQNYNPVDLQGIQNRTSSRYDQGLEQAIQSASGSANRRGLTPGSQAGFAGNLTAQNRNDLSRTLGEQETAYQQYDRQALYDAINNAGNVNQRFLGGELMQGNVLANAVMGAYQPAVNPYENAPDTSGNLAAIDTLEDRGVLDDDTDLWGLFAKLAGSTLGASL